MDSEEYLSLLHNYLLKLFGKLGPKTISNFILEYFSNFILLFVIFTTALK